MDSNQNEEIAYFIGEEPTPEELFFYEQSYKEPVESISRIEETAKFLVGAVTTVTGLFLAALKLSHGKETVTGLTWYLPFLLWSVSIILLLLVLIPREYKYGKSIPAAYRDALIKARNWKYGWLMFGAALFIAGLLSAVFPLIIPGE
ncbi:MAG: hypothetical protein P9L92_11310 [Candidatus Electryonea clarkiae]|nr:hypothetical protein [Candidatus Electryonea clarkiae]MDP8289151.1 hypothetical protein [Candidatus Electryonea clarkiae]